MVTEFSVLQKSETAEQSLSNSAKQIVFQQ